MPSVTFTLEQIREGAKSRPPGYEARLVSMGTLSPDGLSLTLTQEAYDTLVKEYGLWDPAPIELLKNYAKALARYVSAGCPAVEEQTFKDNWQKCQDCRDSKGKPTWDAKARGGRGKCRVCGCDKIKLWWGTEKCPLNKWDNTKAAKMSN